MGTCYVIIASPYQDVLRQSHVLLGDGPLDLPVVLDVTGIVTEAADLQRTLLMMEIEEEECTVWEYN